MMNLRDLLSGLFWLGIAIFVCIESILIDVGTFHYPGPGFLPFWAGVILGTFSIILLVISSPKKKFHVRVRDLWKGTEWKKVIGVLFSLFLYTILLPTMGYLITTFGLMIFLFVLMRGAKLWIQGVSAFIIVLLSYVIFYILLDIKLPIGIFGF